MKPKVRLMGEILFDPNYSSNSTRVPKDFSWSISEGKTEVWIDRGIIHAAGQPHHRKKFGWVMESKGIRPQVAMWLKENYKQVMPQFQAIFTGDQELLDLDSRFKFVFPNSVLPWVPESKYDIYPKTKLCSMIASQKQMCPGHLYRWHIAGQMIQSGRVDVMGGAHGTPKFGIDSSVIHPDKSAGLKDYMFSVVMENASYDHYFTEKLTDCFALGTVPIYWGPPSIGKYFNTDGIITLTDDFDVSTLNADMYYGMMPAIKDNLERVKNLKGSDDYMWDTCFSKL
jgi:hypothetical protein